MAMKWSANIDLRQFNDDMRKLPAQISQAAEKVNQREAARFYADIKRNAPRSETGPHIADTVKLETGDATKHEYVVSIGDDVLVYAAPMEFGHTLNGIWIEGKRFWYPAKVLSARRHRRALARAIRKALKEVFA